VDPVPFIIAAAVGTTLCAAVLALWRMVVVGNRKCEERNLRIEAEIKATKDLMVSKSDADVAKAEAREIRASERAVQIATILDDTKEVTRWAVRVLRRYDPDTQPAPRHGGSGETSALTPVVKE
jgi:hypothetical protein